MRRTWRSLNSAVDLALAFGLLLVAMLGCAGMALAEPPSGTVVHYTLALAPIVPVSEIKRRWQPLADYLSQSTGLEFHLRYYDGSVPFEDAMDAAEPDFIIAGPLQVWNAREHYQPFLRDSKPLIGMIAVMKNSKFRHPSDLQGLRLAIPEGRDFSAQQSIVQMLDEQHIKVQSVLMHTHSNGFRALYLGKVDAATGNNISFSLLEPEIRTQLRVIYQAPPLPPPALVAKRSIPPEHVKLVHDAILRLHEVNPSLMHNALLSNLTDADLDRDYGVLAKLPAPEAAPHAP